MILSNTLPPNETTDDENHEEDIDVLGQPPFPLLCLPPAALSMAGEMARVTTSGNEPLAAASVLGILSAAMGAGLEVRTTGERKSKANLFILAIAESGTGKGENFHIAASPFFEAEAEDVGDWERNAKPELIARHEITEKRLKKLGAIAADGKDAIERQAATREYTEAKSEMAEIQRQLEAGPCYHVGNITQEKLAVILEAQPGEACASLSSEARGILTIVGGRYSKGGGDEDLYCSAYSGDSVTVDRVGRSRVTLHHPCLTVLWMVQPDAARKLLGDDAMTESGLVPRFLLFDPEAEPEERFESPSPISASVKATWSTLIRSLTATYRNNPNAPHVIHATGPALDAMAHYERENIRRRRKNGDLRDLAAFVARWSENAWRLALVLHAGNHGDRAHERPLEAGTAEDAITLMRWFSEMQLQALAASRREKLHKRLSTLLAILAEAKSGMTLRTLRRSHAFSEDEIRQLHQVFPKALNVEKSKGGIGRPSEIVTMRSRP